MYSVAQCPPQTGALTGAVMIWQLGQSELAIRRRSSAMALFYGALFGFFTYATYDLTNQATLRNWTLQLTLIDVLWGVALAATAATSGYLIASKFGP